MIQKLISSTEELTDFMMQHFLQGGVLNVLASIILILRLITLGIIKIQFVNKGIKYMTLSNFYKSRNVISSNPILKIGNRLFCFKKYNIPIRSSSTVFKFNKLVSELDIETNICFSDS